MYGIRGGSDGTTFTSGYVKSMDTQERWGWHKEQLEMFEHGTFWELLLKKLGKSMGLDAMIYSNKISLPHIVYSSFTSLPSHQEYSSW